MDANQIRNKRTKTHFCVVELDPLGKVRETRVQGQVAQSAPGHHGESVPGSHNARAQEPVNG